MKPTVGLPWPCPECRFVGDAETVYAHLLSFHSNRRVATVAPNPGRRAGDTHSPHIQRFLDAGARGEGLSRPSQPPARRVA